MIEKRICKQCQSEYVGGVLSRFCPKCKIARQKMQSLEWNKRKRDKRKAIQEQAARELKQLQEELKKEPEEFDIKKYCKNYDPQEVACIKCYEDQIAKYKRCYKGG